VTDKSFFLSAENFIFPSSFPLLKKIAALVLVALPGLFNLKEKKVKKQFSCSDYFANNLFPNIFFSFFLGPGVIPFHILCWIQLGSSLDQEARFHFHLERTTHINGAT